MLRNAVDMCLHHILPLMRGPAWTALRLVMISTCAKFTFDAGLGETDKAEHHILPLKRRPAWTRVDGIKTGYEINMCKFHFRRGSRAIDKAEHVFNTC